MSNESTLRLCIPQIQGDQINDKLNQAKKFAVQQLRSLKMSGLNVLPTATGQHCFNLHAPAESRPDIDSKPTTPATPTKAAPSTIASESADASNVTHEAKTNYLSDTQLDHFQSDSLSVEQRIEKLAILNQEVSGCTRCKELSSCRTNTVFGVGSPQAELCFLGEGPGADEDRQGEPFVGAAGQLLNKIIEACKMSREDVYILNTVKCRPPGNRNPGEEEIANCWPYAIQQLELLQPKFICCLGSVAAKTLLQTKNSIGRMRGQFFEFRGSRVIVTYHPAYLLRNPSAKRQVWDDMKLLLKAMGREI